MMREYLCRTSPQTNVDELDDLCQQLQGTTTREEVDVVNQLLADFTSLRVTHRREPSWQPAVPPSPVAQSPPCLPELPLLTRRPSQGRKEEDMSDICDMICTLCGSFKSLLLMEDLSVGAVCSNEPELSGIAQALARLCHRVQAISIDDFPDLVSQLVKKFQSDAMALSLTEEMVDSIDQLFSSLSLDSWPQQPEVPVEDDHHYDLDTMCRMMRYMMTSETLEPATLVSYLQHYCILW